jgi:hypothetical protein
MDIKEVLLVVDSLEETLQLTDGTTMNHQHIGNTHWGAIQGLLGTALFPLDARTHLPLRAENRSIGEAHPRPQSRTRWEEGLPAFQ